MATDRKAGIVDEWLEDDRLMLIEAWARDGCTESEIADRIGIYPSTLNGWKKRYEPIRNALKSGKEIVDYKVENALLKAALGYQTKEIKVTVGKQIKNGQTFMITKETTVKDVAPNVTACAMWLNNRRPDKWRRNRDKSIELEEEDDSIQITVVRGPKANSEDVNVNQSVTLQKKQRSTQEQHMQSESNGTIKEGSKDYWPDDWEDEE